jgi:hypothetical protein
VFRAEDQTKQATIRVLLLKVRDKKNMNERAERKAEDADLAKGIK